jgi:sugar phosphate isomerase/epimerase
MRLGGFFEEKYNSPSEWIEILHGKGYRAAYAPFRPAPGSAFPAEKEVLAYARAAEQADIVIAEVGAWGRNYVSEDARLRRLAVEESIRLLEMAEALGARCLVNSAGWREDPAQNFSPRTFDLIVETAQTILDAVKPARTSFTLELVPDIFPYSCDSYVDLLRAVDRKGFGVHFDLANITVSPYLCYHNAELIQDCVDKLGPHIKSCHAKDVVVRKGMVVHIDETRPGLGCLDYTALIRALGRLDPDMPLMLEHLENNQEYQLAADYILSCAAGLEKEKQA